MEGVGDLVGEKVGDEVAATAAAMLSEILDETARLGGANVERDVVDGDEGEEGGEDAGFERNAAEDGSGDSHLGFDFLLSSCSRRGTISVVLYCWWSLMCERHVVPYFEARPPQHWNAIRIAKRRKGLND